MGLIQLIRKKQIGTYRKDTKYQIVYINFLRIIKIQIYF